MDQDQLKELAAESAVKLVTDGMVVGLGTGSTAAFAVKALGRRVREGLRIVGIPTSERTAAQARELGIPLTTLSENPQIDVTIDGADEVETAALNLVKGLGGALLREKIVASASNHLVIIVHDSKLVERLGSSVSVPVEVVPFGFETTARQLSASGAHPVLRTKTGNGEPFITDGGHYILDCKFAPIDSPADLAEAIDHIVGVVEHGLFVGMTSQVCVASENGVRVLTR